MNTKLFMSKTSVIFLIASALFVVGCADKRGFQTKRIKTPFVLDKPDTQNDDSQAPFTGGENSGVPPILEDEQIIQGVEESVESNKEIIDSNPSVDGTQIIYREGGTETPVSPEELTEIKSDLQDIALATKNLPADQQLLKGLSLVRLEGATAESLPVEFTGAVEVEGKSEYFIANLTLEKKQSEEKFAGATDVFAWYSERTDIQGALAANCSGVEQDPCSKISAVIQLITGEKNQVFQVVFQQGENGYNIAGGNAPIVSFQEAQNGVSTPEESAEETTEETESEQTESEQTETEGPEAENTEEEATEENQQVAEQEQEEAQPEQPQQQEPQQEEPQQEEEKEKTVAEETTTQPATPKRSTGPTHRQAEAESMEKLNAMRAEQKRQAQAAEQKRRADMQTFRQAEQKSMENLRKHQAEQKRQAEMKLFREADRKSMENLKRSQTPTHRQAEQQSMKALEQLKAPTHRQAETASMEKLNQMRAEQKRRADMEKFRAADRQSMENLRRSQAPTHRQAEASSMAKLNQMRAEQKKKTPTHRQAEEQSMEALRYKQKIDKILKDNEHADFEDI